MSVKLNEELISIKCQMSDLSKIANTDSFDADKWNELSARKQDLEIDLDKAKTSAAEQAAAFVFEQPSAALAPEKNHVIDQKDGFNKDVKKGYSCGGELIADHIAFELGDGHINGSGSKYRNERYGSYIQSTEGLEVDHASGNASTVIDGVEIIPDLQAGVKEYGAGSGREVLDMFRPLATNRREVEYYVNEDTYNVDGLTVSRIAEGGTMSAQNFNNDLERFRLYKTAVFASITEEDLQNVPLLETRYMQRAPEVLNIQKVQDIIAGDGIAKPLGFTNSGNGALIGLNRDTTLQIKYADLCDMEGRIKRDPGATYFYMANENAISQLCQLSDTSGALLWRPNRNDGLLNPIFHGTLNGRPLLISEDAPLMTLDGGLTLNSTAGYIFGEHTSGTRFAESMHFYFDTDKRALRWISQYGGRPCFNAAYQPRNASAPTLSHFVSLNAAV